MEWWIWLLIGIGVLIVIIIIIIWTNNDGNSSSTHSSPYEQKPGASSPISDKSLKERICNENLENC